MRSRLEKVLESPIFVFLGWLFGLIGVLLTIAFFLFSIKKVSISFEYTTNMLVTDNVSEIEGLDISLNGHKVKQLSVTTCKFINDGNATIDDADVYEGHKITIYPASENTDFYFASIVSQSYDTINSQLDLKDNRLVFRFDTLEKKDEVVINVYHSGDENVEFLVEGKIREGSIDTLTQDKKSQSKKNIYLFLLFAIMFVYYIFDVIYGIRNEVPFFLQIIVLAIIIAIVAFIIAILP